MPKRLTVFLIPQLLICTGALAQSTTPAATSAERTFWDHNGSIMYLVTNESSREFHYQKPRPGMLEAGAHPDDLLFKGQINDGQISGIAYIFNAQCGQIPFHVKGSILENGGRIVLAGQAPHVGRNCQTYGDYASTLEFKLLKSTEETQPPPPSKTAEAPDVKELKPDMPSSEVGEPKLLGSPSAEPPVTPQTRTVNAPKPDVQSSEFGEPTQAGDTPVRPPPTTQVSIATQSLDWKNLAPVIIAMNVALPFLSIGILIWLLKSAQ
jgi:hypothetical protein